MHRNATTVRPDSGRKMRACFMTPTPCYWRASSSDSRSAFISSFPRSPSGSRVILAVLEALWLRTGKALYLDLYKYWLKIFAVVFAMGVVSGIVMSYQFGTNWAVFSDRAGPVIGPLMAYEVLTAFFLEAGFLGVMLFGMRRWAGTAFLRHPDGGDRHLHLGVLDTERQQLDADAGRLRDQRRMGSSCPPAGGCRSSSIRAFPSGWRTPSLPRISPPRWPSAPWAPGTC